MIGYYMTMCTKLNYVMPCKKNFAKMISNCDYRWQIVRHTWEALRQLRAVEMATII